MARVAFYLALLLFSSISTGQEYVPTGEQQLDHSQILLDQNKRTHDIDFDDLDADISAGPVLSIQKQSPLTFSPPPVYLAENRSQSHPIRAPPSLLL